MATPPRASGAHPHRRHRCAAIAHHLMAAQTKGSVSRAGAR